MVSDVSPYITHSVINEEKGVHITNLHHWHQYTGKIHHHQSIFFTWVEGTELLPNKLRTYCATHHCTVNHAYSKVCMGTSNFDSL